MNIPITGSLSSWRLASVTLGLAMVALIAIFWETAASVVALWSKDPLAHGYIVIPAVVYLAWTRRQQLTSLSPAAAFQALPLIGLFAFLWLLGNLSDTRVVQQVCLVAMLIGFVWGVLGSPAAMVLLFPLGFLIFAMPLGDRFVPMLQDLAARSAVKMLVLSGIPVLLQGHIISLPRGTWKVAEACSGINYLTASLALGYFYAGTTYRYWSHRIGFLVGAVLVPLFANGLRVYGTILIAFLAGNESIAGTRHYLFGWFVFAIMMGLLFAICGRWHEDPAEGVVTPKTMPRSASATSPWRPVLVATLGLLVVALASASAELLQLPVGHASSGPQPPHASLPWVEVDLNPYSWRPHFETPSAEFVRTYRSDSRFVKVYVASYAASQPRAKLASVTNVLIPEPWWVTGREHRTVTFAGRSIRVRETHVEGPSSLVVWNWYWVDGTFTDSDYLAQLLLAKARIFRSAMGSAALAIATESSPGLEPEMILEDFLLHLSPTPMSGVAHTDVNEKFEARP